MSPARSAQHASQSRAERFDTEIKSLLHTLQVYQVELETQNEELKRAQRELAATLERYTELYDQAPVGYVTLDARGRITQSNRAAKALLQLPAVDSTPIPLTQYVARHSVALLRNQLARARRDGAAPAIEIHMSPLGSDLRLCVRLDFSVDASAQSLRVVLTNVTSLRLLEHVAQYETLVEHQRMSADIHDGLSQDLTGISLSLRALQTRVEHGGSPAVAEIEELQAITTSALDSCRGIVRGLSPVGENEGGLIPALHSIVARTALSAGIPVTLDVTGPALVRVPIGTADHLFRIAQECLTNARKHSGASVIRMSLDVQSDAITLVVEDDGSGYDTARPDGDSQRMGLRLMQFRATSIDAELSSRSAVGRGTRVCCVCPQPPA